MLKVRHLSAAALLLLTGTVLYSLYHALDIRLPHIQAAYFTDHAFRSTRVKGEQFPKLLMDATGAEHLLSVPPERIVSLTLGADEMLYDLVEHRRIIGVTYLADASNNSNIANKFAPHIARTQAQIEQVLALEPDLVFVASYTRAETVRLLLGAGIAVVRLSEHSSFAGLELNIRLVGQVTGREQQARNLLANLRKDVDTIESRIQSRSQGLSAPRVLFYSLDGYTAGPGTLVDEMINIAGGYNVIRDTGINGFQKISAEMAIGLEPDVILMSGGSTQNQPQTAQLLLANPIWQQLPAIQQHRVYNVNDAWTLSVSHYSWNGIGQIARHLYPGVFKPCSANPC